MVKTIKFDTRDKAEKKNNNHKQPFDDENSIGQIHKRDLKPGDAPKPPCSSQKN